MNNRNYSGLTSVGSEIMTSNISSQRNLLFSAGKKPKLIVKSYKITNDTSMPEISNNIINNNNNDKITEENKINNISNPNIKSFESKKESSLNISHIKYKDGYILKDAANSNPGFGLWAIKTPIEKESKPKDEKIFNISSLINKSYKSNNNRSISNETDLNYKYTKFFDEDRKKNIKNKKTIEKLNNKLTDLERKYMEALSKFQEKKYLCENTIKMKKEYEEMLNNNILEIKLIQEKAEEIEKQNDIVENALINTKNEIERLLNVNKEDDKNMNKIKNEFEIRLQKEAEERIKLNEIIKQKEEIILNLTEQTKNLTTNTFIFEEIIGNENRKNFEIKRLQDMVLNLQIKISGLKKEINNNNEEMEKLRQILRYKNMKEEYQTLNISNLFYIVEDNINTEKRKNEVIKKQNIIIRNLNENLRRQYNIVTSKKLHKSLSQGMLVNKNNSNKF
jgi:hypothetical protein